MRCGKSSSGCIKPPSVTLLPEQRAFWRTRSSRPTTGSFFGCCLQPAPWRAASPLHRVHAVKLSEFAVDGGRLDRKLLRPLEEHFRRDREELGRIAGTIAVDHR
jgi:hypothetical protein